MRALLTTFPFCEFKDLRIAETIGERAEWYAKPCKPSPGTRTQPLVVNTLVHRKPLYKVEGLFAEQDTQVLFETGLEASDVNDDALARVLDALVEADPKAAFSQLAPGAVVAEGSERRLLHGDTTSGSVYGEYEEAGEHLKIVHRYSKDHRPDLEQFMYGLIVTTEGLPVMGEVLDGHTSDDRWNEQVLSEFDGLMAAKLGEDIISIADAALCSEENLKRAAKRGRCIITRWPATLGGTIGGGCARDPQAATGGGGAVRVPQELDADRWHLPEASGSSIHAGPCS